MTPCDHRPGGLRLALITLVVLAAGAWAAAAQAAEVPVVTGTSPASPANDNAPAVVGTADPGATVTIYATAACSDGGPALGSGLAAAGGAFSVPVSVPDDSTTTFFATAQLAADPLPSACSSTSATYVEDSLAPALPLLTATAPASPANDNEPEVQGSAEAGATVQLYGDETCTGAVLGSGTAETFNGGGITASVADDTSTTIRAVATDAVGNRSACSTASLVYVEDSTPPAPPVVDGTSPASPANANSPAVFGTAEAGSTVELFGAAGCLGDVLATGTAEEFGVGIAIAVLDDTTTTLSAVATDAAGNASTCSVLGVEYVEDSTPPTTFLASGPPPLTNETEQTIELGASEPDARFLCSLDAGPSAECTSPVTYAGLAAGAHTFSAVAFDLAGNVDLIGVTVAWEIDLTAPQTTLVSAPATPTRNRSATFAFTSNAPDASFRCSLDGGTPTACTSPIEYAGLAEGEHVFVVTAVDASGNADPSAAFYAWVVDRTNPDTAITSGPVGTVDTSSATFTFSASESGSAFECRIDGGAFVVCTSPASYGGLAAGAHTFDVRAVDAAGNRDPSPAQLAWTSTATPLQLVGQTPRPVRSVRIYGGIRKVTIRWRPPPGTFAYVEVTRQEIAGLDDRTATGSGAGARVIYRGNRRIVTDRKVKPGSTYLYTLVTVSASGRTSKARRRVAFPTPLFRLATRTRTSERPLLRWVSVKKADFYNVQLFWKGQKVLSAWPESPKFRVPKRWTFEGKRFRFNRPGRLDWFVFPGYRDGSEVSFGDLLGRNYFFVKKRRPG